MYANEVQRHGLYEEFHMSGKAGRKTTGMSTVDTLIFGRDIDGSGEMPHESRMGRLQGLAGKPTQEKSDRPSRKLAGASMKSTMDTTIWGRDIDKSDAVPRENLLKSSAQQADRPAGFQKDQDRPNRRAAGSTKAGQILHTHAGRASATAQPRSFRGLPCGLQAQTDDVVFGRDTDMSGPDPQGAHFQKKFGSHAGVKTGERSERPYRKIGISQKATVDDVVFQRDIDGSGENPQVEHFTGLYGDYAGRMAGGSRAVGKHVDPRDPSFKKGKGATSTTFAPKGRTQSQPGSYAPSDDGRLPERQTSDASSYAGSSSSRVLPSKRSVGARTASEAGTTDAGVSVASGYTSRSSCPSSRGTWR